jgi:aminoglycoside phosphotransferase (APT) family kinase protein
MNEIESSRARAQSLLRHYGLNDRPIELLTGWTNKVWLTPDHAVRISSGRFRDSFRHEYAVARLIGDQVRIPEIVANGDGNGSEWMISVRVPGRSLLHSWTAMQQEERQDAVHQLAASLSKLHSVEFPDGFSNPWLSDSVIDKSKTQDAYLIEPRHFRVITDDLREKKLLDDALLNDAEQYLTDRLVLFNDDQHVLIHGDAHFNNMIWDGSHLTLLDLEVVTTASRERELQAIIDFTRQPEMVYGRNETPDVHKRDVENILHWLREAYPALFAVKNIVERLDVYSLVRGLLQIYHFPPESEYDTRPRLRDLLAGKRDLPDIFYPD